LNLFLKHKAGEEGAGLIHREVVESAIKDHLGEEELVASANLAGHAPFHVDHVCGRGEAKSPEDALPALELFHLHDGVRRLDFLAKVLNLVVELHLVVVKFVKLLELRRPSERIALELLLQSLDFLWKRRRKKKRTKNKRRRKLIGKRDGGEKRWN